MQTPAKYTIILTANAAKLPANIIAGNAAIEETRDIKARFEYNADSFYANIYIDYNSYPDAQWLEISQCVMAGAGLLEGELFESKTLAGRMRNAARFPQTLGQAIEWACKCSDTLEAARDAIGYPIDDHEFARRRDSLTADLRLANAREIEALEQVAGDRVLVKAPTGTGKTQMLVIPAIEAALAAGQRVAYITVSRALVDSMQVDGLTDYRELAPGKTYRSVKTCVHSIWKPAIRELIAGADLVVIDEVEQVVRQIFTGEVRQRAKVWKAFKHLVCESDARLVAVDADLTDATARLFQGAEIYSLDRDVYSGITANIIDGKTAFEQAACATSALVATDSKAQANRLAEMYKVTGRKTLLITADTVMGDEQQAFITDTSKAALYDCVIYTPAMASGVSINDAYFQAHFALFTGAILPTDAVQMIRRDRTATKMTIGLYAPRDKSKAYSFTTSELDTLIRERMTREQHSKRYFRQGLIDTLKALGFSLELCDHVSETAKDTAKIAKKLDDKAYADGIMAATPAQSTESLDRTTDSATFFAIERQRIESLMGPDITADKVLEWKRGQLATWVHNVELAQATFDQADRDAIEQKNRHIAAIDRNLDPVKSDCLAILLSAVEAGEIVDAKALVSDLKSAGWDQSGLPVIASKAQAMRTIVRLARELLGVTVKSERISREGKQARVYRTVQSSLEAVMQYVRQPEQSAEILDSGDLVIPVADGTAITVDLNTPVSPAKKHQAKAAVKTATPDKATLDLREIA